MVAPKRERWIILGGNDSGVRWVDGLVIVGDGSGSRGWEWKTTKIFSIQLGFYTALICEINESIFREKKKYKLFEILSVYKVSKSIPR